MKERGPILSRWARAKLREALGGPLAVPPDAAWCDEQAATFVTLRWRDGELQGCIGSLEAERSIVADVARNAIAAATRSPYAGPIALADVDELDVEVSLLSPLEKLDVADEAAAIATLRVGVDGVVLAHGGRRATFLPVMWATFSGARELVAALKRKGGWSASFWSDDMTVWRYTAERYIDRAGE